MSNRSAVWILALSFLAWLARAGRADDSRLVHEAVVEAPLAEVWAAFTTGKGQESWMVAHAEIDLRVGGKMRTHYNPKGKLGDAGTIENTILSYDPLHMLSIKVSRFPKGFPFPQAIKSMWTVIYFEKVEARRTRVREICLGFGSDEESQKMRKFFDRGNAYTMKQLQKRFAQTPKK